MKLIFDIALFIPLLPVALLFVVQDSWHPVKKDFTRLLIAILIISFGAEGWKMLGNRNTMLFFHVYLLVEFFLLTKIFIQLMQGIILKWNWVVFSGVFLFVWLVNGFWGQSFAEFPNFPLGVEAVLVLIYTLSWFRKMLREKKIKEPTKNFEFWFCTGLFVFFSGNLLIFIFYLFIMGAEVELLNPIWAIHAILIILLYLLYSFAILWMPKTIK